MVGYAVLWHRPAIIRRADKSFEERFRRGAFAASIAAGDVRLCLDHNWRDVVARQSDGSLRLIEDDVGLMVDAVALDTLSGDDALAAVRCRSRAGLSVGFDLGAGAEWSEGGGIDVREIVRCRLREVSICRHPAYRSSEIHAGAMRIERFFADSVRANRFARLATAEANCNPRGCAGTTAPTASPTKVHHATA
jgi:HK97 family phage prohead protease